MRYELTGRLSSTPSRTHPSPSSEPCCWPRCFRLPTTAHPSPSRSQLRHAMFLPFIQTAGEHDIWLQAVTEVEGRIEEHCETEWSVHTTFSLPDIHFPSSSAAQVAISTTKVDSNALASKLRAAAGPSFHSPQRGGVSTEGNPHWPQNDPNQWNYEFGTRMARALASAIDQTIEHLSLEGADLPAVARDIARATSDQWAPTLQAVGNAVAGVHRRTALLWWKEALYSPTAAMSYRDMPAFEAAVLMAFDLHRNVPTFSPASVVTFLRETVITIPSIDDQCQLSMRHLLDKTQKARTLAQLRTETSKLVSAPAGRGPLLRLIGHPEAQQEIDDTKFRDIIGVKADAMLTLPDWSVWLFREFQAARATVQASAPKPRSSKRRPRRK